VLVLPRKLKLLLLLLLKCQLLLLLLHQLQQKLLLQSNSKHTFSKKGIGFGLFLFSFLLIDDFKVSFYLRSKKSLMFRIFLLLLQL
jgi:hypothetical protein